MHGFIPDKISTMRAKCGLSQKRCHEFMSIDLVNTATHGSTTSV